MLQSERARVQLPVDEGFVVTRRTCTCPTPAVRSRACRKTNPPMRSKCLTSVALTVGSTKPMSDSLSGEGDVVHGRLVDARFSRPTIGMLKPAVAEAMAGRDEDRLGLHFRASSLMTSVECWIARSSLSELSVAVKTNQLLLSSRVTR